MVHVGRSTGGDCRPKATEWASITTDTVDLES